MFDKYLKREKPRIYLAVLVVAPHSTVQKYFGQVGLVQAEELEMGIRQSLREVFAFPVALDIKEPADTDLGMEVIVPSFQSGLLTGIWLNDIGFPLFWRPKVTVSLRLYYLKSGKTKATF